MKTKFLKPGAEGLKVPKEPPATGHVDAEGEDLPLTSFYRRLEADGDLVAARRPKTAKEGK